MPGRRIVWPSARIKVYYFIDNRPVMPLLSRRRRPPPSEHAGMHRCTSAMSPTSVIAKLLTARPVLPDLMPLPLAQKNRARPASATSVCRSVRLIAAPLHRRRAVRRRLVRGRWRCDGR
jgi:hypothetical protein